MNYGIVAEFNPLHNGHKFLMDSLKKDGDNTITVVMSESFVQRGECASVSPYTRTKSALMNGADLVLSLPVAYATASAERFAFGGISVLGGLGLIDCLAFGSECGDSKKLKKCAEAVVCQNFSRNLEKHLTEGVSFPVAREKAVCEILGEEYSSIISTPNNILGVEYIKAVNSLGLGIDIMPVTRKGVGHDSAEVNAEFCSASEIRNMMIEGREFKKYLPESSYQLIAEEIMNCRAPAAFLNIERAILYKLRSMSAEDLSLLPDVSEGLEYRFFEAIKTSAYLDEILEKVKTKRYTLSRLRRIVVCALLGIKKEDVIKPVPYIRVLGFNKKGAELLKQAKSTATLPVVTKSSEINSLGTDAQRLFSLECFARDVFSLALPTNDVCGKEMTDKLIVL